MGSRYRFCSGKVNLASGSRYKVHLFAEFLLFELVTIMLWLERAISAHADIAGLLFVQLGQLHADAIQVQTRHFFVEVLGQDIHVIVVIIAFGPQLDLR